MEGETKEMQRKRLFFVFVFFFECFFLLRGVEIRRFSCWLLIFGDFLDVVLLFFWGECFVEFLRCCFCLDSICSSFLSFWSLEPSLAAKH